MTDQSNVSAEDFARMKKMAGLTQEALSEMYRLTGSKPPKCVPTYDELVQVACQLQMQVHQLEQRQDECDERYEVREREKEELREEVNELGVRLVQMANRLFQYDEDYDASEFSEGTETSYEQRIRECADATASLAVDFERLRGRVRDGEHRLERLEGFKEKMMLALTKIAKRIGIPVPTKQP